MAEAWITYADIAEALGITPLVARQKAIRGRWRSRRGKHGRALVLVDLEAEKASHVARPVERRTVEALEAQIAFLKAAVAEAEALAEQPHRRGRGGPGDRRQRGRAGGAVTADGRALGGARQGTGRVRCLPGAALVTLFLV